jgi:SulP family sulfate permease
LAKQIPIKATSIIIRMDRMPYMDQTGLYVMEEILIDLVKSGKTVLLVDIIEQPRYMMERIDIIPDLIPQEHIFEDFKKCLSWIKENEKGN